MERVTHNDKKVKNRAAVGRIERQIVEFLASGINGVNVDDVVNAVNNNCDYGGEIIIWVDVYLKLKKDLLGKWPKGLIYKVAHHQHTTCRQHMLVLHPIIGKPQNMMQH